MLNTSPLSIDIVSDVVCPWCYVGKRRLEAALVQRGNDHAQTQVRWLAFQLNPDIPAGGIDRRSYLEQKFGGLERTKQIYARIKAAGDEVGIDPNATDALIERLFRAYFVDGIDIGDIEALAGLAGDAGFDATAARAWLASDAGRAAIEAEERRSRALGVTGVPFFVFNQRLAVSGAQPPEVLLEAIEQASQSHSTAEL